MTWHGHLSLHYRREADRTTALDRHDGPLRVLQRLYPEGPGICHHVLVHPPGGIVGGDVLAIDATLETGTHAVITTPGANRFYRSDGPLARQAVQAQVAAGARLEWLPLETIAYPGCRARNELRFQLAPGAEMMGWDVIALGLPAAGRAWTAGRYDQHLSLPGIWLEQARLDATDRRLLDGPVGWAGRTVLATMWWAAGAPLAPARRDALVDAARGEIDAPEAARPDPGGPLPTSGVWAGVSAPHDEVVVLRALAHRVEPAMRLLARVRGVWREAAWSLPSSPPRIWRT